PLAIPSLHTPSLHDALPILLSANANNVCSEVRMLFRVRGESPDDRSQASISPPVAAPMPPVNRFSNLPRLYLRHSRYLSLHLSAFFAANSSVMTSLTSLCATWP